MVYRIIWEENQLTFIDNVNKALKLGWMLQGGVSMSKNYEGRLCWCQAVIKKG